MKPYHQDPNMVLYHGDVLDMLKQMPEESVQCVVTSPPYWGLRDYGVDGQLGLEATPAEYVANIVEIFREVRRVLRKDGILWLNMGDSYMSHSAKSKNVGGFQGAQMRKNKAYSDAQIIGRKIRPNEIGLKDKDLCGMPWRVAFALQADGWWLRKDNIWFKDNPMPESCTDRTTTAHEYIFHLTKAAHYYYDSFAIREKAEYPDITFQSQKKTDKQNEAFLGRAPTNLGRCGTSIDGTRNKRSVWQIPTQPYPEAHFATYPEKLVEPCILAGSRTDDTVLDPFAGSGTTLAVAIREGRKAIGIELNEEYLPLIMKRTRQTGFSFA